MSAASQPANPELPIGDNWQSLVRDQGYRLFAAGDGRAVIIEGLPAPPLRGKQKLTHTHGPSFDMQFGLGGDPDSLEGRFVVLTEVSRAHRHSRSNGNGAALAHDRNPSPWSAVRTIQPLASLSSLVARRAGNLVFFLVRSARPPRSPNPAQQPRLDVSAVQIGRSLGLGQTELEALRVAGLVCEMGKADLAGRSAGDSGGDSVELPAVECHYPGCSSLPAVQLETKAFCRDHFIVHCYEKLDFCAEHISQRPAGDQESEHLRSFLRACIERASELTRAPFLQDSLERARLLDIRYTAADLLRKMRRSPRLAEARPVRLLCETPGRPWQEELRTVLISRFGALFECQHLVRAEDWLFVERLDNGTRARARMAWRAPAKAGHFSVGLEFLDSENFWDLNWKSCPPAAPLPA